MVNINKLRGKIVECGINTEALADSLGIDKTTLYRRFSNGEDFTIGEARKIATVLNLTADELNSIFFND